MTYPLGEEIFRKQQTELFNFIYLNVKYYDIYSAFENYIFSTMEDFRNDKGDIVTAEKTLSILSPP